MLSIAFMNLEMKTKCAFRGHGVIFTIQVEKPGELRKLLNLALSLAFRLASFLHQLTQVISDWGPGLLDPLFSWSLCIQKSPQPIRIKSFSTLVFSTAF